MNKKGATKTEAIKKVFHCDICNKGGFSTSYKLKAHLFLHKAIPARHKCNYCPKEYYRSDEFTRHISAHEKKQKLHYCDHCDRSFIEKRNLILHLNVHEDMPITKHRYSCAACGVDYCEERLLKYHIRKEHLNLNTAEPVHINKKLNDTWIENVMDSKSCVQITKIKLNTLAIKRCKLKRDKLVSKIKNEKNIFQQYIASVFATKDNYYSKAICDYCGKEMLKKSIVTHIRERHLKMRRFHCEECNRTFMRHYQLCLHNCGKQRRRRKKIENTLQDSKIKVKPEGLARLKTEK